MMLDVHDPGLATRQAAEVAQRYAIRSVEAARGLDLNEPAQAARAVATRTARRAARRASVAAKRAAGRTVKRRARHVARRVALIAVGAGAVATVVLIVARRSRITPWDPTVDAGPSRFTAPSADGDADASDSELDTGVTGT
jgi:hypothetical protein